MSPVHEINGQPQEGYLNLTRRMENEDEDQFDVDLTILDFLVFKAIGLVFEWRSSSDPYHSDLPNALVNMTADWRSFLGQRHHGRRLDPKASFRSRLLQFALIFTHRLHHDETWTTEETLNSLREQNKQRGEYWQQRTEHAPALTQAFDPQKDFPLSDGALYENRSSLASALRMPQDQRRWVTDVAGTPSLHCLLPVFIELTAARVALDDDWLPTAEWFHLAAQFMLQAVIGEYLRNGAYGPEPFNTIFAYGCPGVDRWADEPADVSAMRRLFCAEGHLRRENPQWTSIKREYVCELLPKDRQEASSCLKALEAAQRKFPYQAFEDRLLCFLQDLHHGLVKPDLAQVEEGRINIDGNELSEEESRAMIQRMGL